MLNQPDNKEITLIHTAREEEEKKKKQKKKKKKQTTHTHTHTHTHLWLKIIHIGFAPFHDYWNRDWTHSLLPRDCEFNLRFWFQ